MLLDVNIGRKFALIIQREFHLDSLREDWERLAFPVINLGFGDRPTSRARYILAIHINLH